MGFGHGAGPFVLALSDPDRLGNSGEAHTSVEAQPPGKEHFCRSLLLQNQDVLHCGETRPIYFDSPSVPAYLDGSLTASQ